jgi:hypothetical protein
MAMNLLKKTVQLSVILALLIGVLMPHPSIAQQSERLSLNFTFSEQKLTDLANKLLDVIPGLGTIADISIDLQAQDSLWCWNATVTPLPPIQFKGYLCLKVEYKEYRLYLSLHSIGLGESITGIDIDKWWKSLKKPLRKLTKKVIKKALKGELNAQNLIFGDWKLSGIQITDTELILTVSND